MKKILLLMVAALFLCGAASAQNWGTPDSHAKSSNTPIVAKVTLGETVQEAGTLGAFVGDELRGLATIHTDGNFWIQAFYNEGETNPDEFTFKFYDGQQEYTNCTTTLVGQEEGYGTPNSPVELVFANEQTMTQTTEFAQGWSWWSTPIEQSDIDGLTMLENSIGTSGVKIQSKNDGFVTRLDYNGNSYWYGTLNSITNEQMYKVNTNEVCSASMVGHIASLSDHPITINNGWNWIGFPSNQSLSVSTAMAGYTPTANDQIKSKDDGFTTYIVYGSTSMWYGTLTTLEPGIGYMYKSNNTESQTLIFQNSRGEIPIANIVPENNTFMSENNSYADNMTVTAVVELEGVELRSDDYEVVVFANGECRGSVKLMYVEPLDQYLAFLLVAGDVEENLDFMLTNGIDASWSADHLVYTSDAIVGTPTEPVVLHFGHLDFGDNTMCFAELFPNPVNSGQTFSMNIPTNEIVSELVIVNSLGQVVRHERETLKNTGLAGLNATGVYTVRVMCQSGNVYLGKLVVK